MLVPVFALWRNPKLCTTLYIASNTSEYMLKGADLMLPGVLVPASGLNFRKGQAVSVSVSCWAPRARDRSPGRL